MTSNHGRRIQIRRALAILTWLTLVVVAGLLWYGQHERVIRVQAWEPASLLLSAYVTFLSIFGWLLFSPGRKSAEESPGLFFSGILTLVPPCFIAYHLMPIGSPLKPWLTIGVFLFGVLAIMSPLPDEVFAVPRHRRSYLQPLTDAYLSELNVAEPQVSFDNLVPRTVFRLSRPAQEPEIPSATATRDPWADPFYGTGRQMSRIGVSQSRRSAESPGQDRRQLTEEPPSIDPNPPVAQRSDELRAVETANRATSIPATAGSRRPLTEPSHRPYNPVGFQTPTPPARPLSPSPPPLPPSALPSASGPLEIQPPGVSPSFAPTPRPLSDPTLRGPVSGVPSTTPFPPLATAQTALTTPAAAGGSLRQLDQQLRAMEADDEHDMESDPGSGEPTSGNGSLSPVSGVTRSVQQSSSDIRLERIRDEHGGEMIEGTIQVFFDIGQKRAHLHVPFSPPLPGLPEVECEPTGEDSIRVKVAVRQPYGIRLEARRSEASESLKAEVSFAAVYTPNSRRG